MPKLKYVLPLLILSLTLLSSQAQVSDDDTITNIFDCGDTSVAQAYSVTDANNLIAAIHCANANASTADSITVTGDITLTTVDNTDDFIDTSELDGSNGLPLITSELTIQSDSTQRTIARDTTATDFRLFVVTDGGNLTLDNLIIANGLARNLMTSSYDDVGGAIFNDGTTTVNNTTFTGNSAEDEGGVIYNWEGTVTLNDSMVTSNSAFDAIVYNESLTSTLIVNNTTFSGNQAVICAGVGNKEGVATIRDSIFDNNTADEDGSAICNADVMTIRDSQFIDNIAYDDATISNFDDLTIIDSVFSGNDVDDEGGAIDNEGTLMVINSLFEDNTARDGGAIFNERSTTIINSVISGNSASLGGAIYNEDQDVTIINSTIVNNTSTTGGALWKFDDSATFLTIYNSIVWGNSSDVITNPAQGVTVENTAINDATFASVTNITSGFVVDDFFIDAANGDYTLRADSPAIDAGARIYLPDESGFGIDIDDDSIVDDPIDVDYRADDVNHPRVLGAAVDMGAYEYAICDAYDNAASYILGSSGISDPIQDLITAIECANANATDDTIDLNGQTITLTDIYVNSNGGNGLPLITSNVTIRNGIIERDTNSTDNFRLLNVASSGELTLSDLTLTGGVINNGGGAVYVEGVLNATDVHFNGNSASLGGAIDTSFLASIKLANVTFTNNSTTSNSGGAFYNSGNIDAVNVILNGNSAPFDGAAFENSGTMTLTNALVINNTGAAAIYNGGGASLEITNATVADNPDSEGIYHNGTSLLLYNSIVYGNGATGIRGNAASVAHSLIEGGYAGTNNLNTDPMFTDPNNGDYTLQSNSPAINTGDNDRLPSEIFFDLDIDVDGDGVTDTPIDVDIRNDDTLHPRISGGLVDMGAYEFDFCTANYSFGATYTLGASGETNLEADLTNAINCANENNTNDTIDFDSQTVSYASIYDSYSGDTAFPSITSNITLQNGIVDRDVTATDPMRVFYVDTTGHLTLDTVTIQNVAAERNGGAVHVDEGSLTVNMSNFYDNTLSNGSYEGAAIYNLEGSATITDSNFRNNDAPDEGGAIFMGEGMMNITGSTFQDNYSAYGGAIYIDASTVTIADTLFDTNGGDLAGAVGFDDGLLTITDSQFINNTGVEAGAIYGESDTIIMNNSVISGNSGDNVAAIFAASSFFGTNLSITGNTSVSGVVIEIWGGGASSFVNTVITGNVSAQETIFNNARNSISNDVTFINSTIANNTVTTVNMPMINNDASGDMTFANSIIYGNRNLNGDVVGIYNGSSSLMELFNNLYETVTDDGIRLEANSVVGQNPLFVSPIAPSSTASTGGDYSLQQASPAVNAGSDFRLPEDTYDGDGDANDTEDVDYDITLAARICNGTVDMGAYETIVLDFDNNDLLTPSDGVYVINRVQTTDLTADVDCDADVDSVDVLLILDELGTTP